MNNIQQQTLHSELHLMQTDTLNRLEWPKITHYLASFAVFTHTKETLKTLSPWTLEKTPLFYKESTEEMQFLFEKGVKPNLENFVLESFEQSLEHGALLSPIGLYQISIVLKLANTLQAFFKKQMGEEQKSPNLFELSKNLKPQLAVMQMLIKSVNEEGSILENASTELAQAHRNCANAKRKITENLEHILKNSVVKNAIQDSTWMLKDGRYVLPVRTDRKNDVEGIARGLSQSGSTVFIEPKALANEQAALEKALLEIQIEEYKIIKLLSEACYLIREDIFTTVEALTQLDEIYARAQFASVLEATPCDFQEKGSFSFQNARHPLFILEKKPCIPNTLELLNSNVWVLSGPNAGGKTVAMKTVGVLVLMAKCGLFVPSENSQCLNYENIFVELGDRQNREEDLSTFSGHLEQLKKIMKIADEKSLILLDEGFVGTDPAVGVALARSVLEYFAEKKSTVIITTHFSSLKTLANDDPRFSNASMEFEARNLRPTYKVLNGIPGQSYALELCERMGIQKNIISEARKYYGTESIRMENILQELQEQKINLNEEINKHKDLSVRLQNELQKIQNEQKMLLETKENLVESYRVKLQKRLNAFANRLEVRTRQFEKQLYSSQLTKEQIEEKSIESNPGSIISNTPSIASQEIPRRDKNKVSLSSFDDLAKIKFENHASNLHAPNIEPEKFRQPKNMSQRSLLDEASESLDLLNKSFEGIEDDLNTELSYVLKLNQETKHKAQNLKSNLFTNSPHGKQQDYWKVGMRVKTQKFSEVGNILKIADNKGLVECQFGFLKIKLPHSELMTIEESAKQKTIQPKIIQKKNNHSFKKPPNVKNVEIHSVLPHKGNSIDLRGKTVDESMDYLEQEIDKLWREEVSHAVIIHGHGQGRVKEAVRKYLESASYELTFRPGRPGEGGDGVTIVEF